MFCFVIIHTHTHTHTHTPHTALLSGQPKLSICWGEVCGGWDWDWCRKLFLDWETDWCRNNLQTGASEVALAVKNLLANAGDTTDVNSVPGSGRSPGGGDGNALQYSCQRNPMDRGAWRATVHRVAKSWTQDWSDLAQSRNCFYSLFSGHYRSRYNLHKRESWI